MYTWIIGAVSAKGRKLSMIIMSKDQLALRLYRRDLKEILHSWLTLGNEFENNTWIIVTVSEKDRKGQAA